MILKEIPFYERPREKVLNEGIDRLSNVELIAILLRTGSKKQNVLRLSEQLLYKLSNITDFNQITVGELTAIEGIGEAKAITILAAVELGKRMSSISKSQIIIKNGYEAFKYLKNKVQNETEERLFGLYLTAKGGLISAVELTKGTINTTIIDPRLIFKWYYKLSASAVILVHNHPSGDPNPSIQDLKMTEEIVKKAKVLNINILDHVIIGENYYSMLENNKYFNIFKNV